MADFFYIVVGIIVVLFIGYFFSNNKTKKETPEEYDKRIKLEKEEDKEFKYVASNFYYSGELQKIKIKKQRIKFSNIISFEPYTHMINESRTRTKSSPSLGKALVGGALFGEVGALVGGVSGKQKSVTTTSDLCDNIGIKITINDLSNPIIDLNLLHCKCKTNEYLYRSAMKDLDSITSILSIIINQNKDAK